MLKGKRLSARYPGKEEDMTETNPHWGSSLDDLLGQEGIKDIVRAEAAVRVIAWNGTHLCHTAPETGFGHDQLTASGR